jgi:hypothetical protein
MPGPRRRRSRDPRRFRLDYEKSGTVVPGCPPGSVTRPALDILWTHGARIPMLGLPVCDAAQGVPMIESVGSQPDTDDQLSDSLEQRLSTRPTGADADSEGPSDVFEQDQVGTSPPSVDTDTDGVSDLLEQVLDASPDRTDTDQDGPSPV